MHVTSDISDEAMARLSVELIKRAVGKSPVVHMKMDASGNLQRLYIQTHVVLPEAVRVEFVRNETFDIGKYAGALVYGENDQLLVRLDNAVLGEPRRGGLPSRGGMLCKRLLELLEVPSHVFQSLDDEVACGRVVYGIVVQVR